MEITEDGKMIRDSSRFTVSIRTVNQGIILLRMFDQVNERQQADVYVDNEFAGIWYHAGRNIHHRWKEDEFMVSSALTFGKSAVTVSIRRSMSAGEWNEYRYRVYTLIDTFPIITSTIDTAVETSGVRGDEAVNRMAIFDMSGRLLYYSAGS
ncbi:MAG: hypothetical protein JW913_11865 [Chitinispirillaceae bacterium]|nr:hypothetical protein [Chitinispirillaceae bacterium]